MDEVATALESSFRPAEVQPSAFSLPSPGQPKRSRPLAKWIGLVAAAAALFLGGSALVHSLLPESGEKESFERREAEIIDAMSRFHPGAARALAIGLQEDTRGTAFETRASRLAEEATWMVRLQTRTSERLAVNPLEVAHLQIREPRTVAPARIIGSDLSGLRSIQDGRITNVPWEKLDPASLIEILLGALGQPEDADLLGLGILSLRTGLAGEANSYFARLRSTSLGPIAERYQATPTH
jgi:hypothetical protein